MKNRIIVFALLSMSLIYSASAQNYKVDASHTSVTSKVQRFGVVNVMGRFTAVSGTIAYSPDNLSKTTGEVIIKTDSYSANNAAGETAIKSQAFLDVANFPEIKFVVKGLSGSNKAYTVTGAMTIHGVTKDVTFPVTINGPSVDLPTSKQSIGIGGKLVINRQDYDIKMSRKMPNGLSVVGDDVEIEFNILAIAE